MPRMSKKLKKELAFFLNDRGRRSYNELCRKCQHECKQSFRAVIIDCPAIYPNEPKGGHKSMNCEFMIASTPLPPCMPLPKAMLRLPVSNTAKVMYARLLDEILTRGTEDCNGILFIRFPIMEIAAALSRSPQTCKRSLNELEQAGMIMRVRQGIGEVSHIYILLPKEDAAHE
ncbi:hypothetical protein C823_004662 [Eubacterium plexicaudatum ASF492]|nr:hypothetical protein C823_004662 [Eubacterium plexicaudatum ASF492]